MSTVEVEVLRREAVRKEKNEIEQIREKYRKQRKQGKYTRIVDLERQAIMQEAQIQETKEKEKIRQKYQKRKKEGQLKTKNTHTNLEREALIQEAQIQEAKEKEKIRQKYRERFKLQEKKTTHTYPEKIDLPNSSKNEVVDEELVENTIFGENEALETIDRSALMEKFNLKDVQEDDVDHILQNFDRTILDEDVEEIETQLAEKIKNSLLSHKKMEWVNVLVFFNEEELEGSIKIFAEYVDGGLLTRFRSDDIQRLELELMQLALYDVWDVFTTLGVNIDDLESKLDIEVTLDRA